MTLTKINTQPNYSTSTDTLNKLGEFFNCEISELIEFIPEKKFKELQEQQIVENRSFSQKSIFLKVLGTEWAQFGHRTKIWIF